MVTLKRILTSAFMLAALSFMGGFAHADQTQRDGNWWNQQSESFKIAYVVGFLDGMSYEDDLWKGSLMLAYPKFDPDGPAIKLTKFMDDHESREFGNVTSGQIVDGLNKIYADYRNRRIDVVNAMTLVVRSMDGTPDAELRGYFEVQRKKAAGS
ncbi:hypothetical protein [Rhodanobacter terrae]|uniref:Uncharacterized protein n=1 Tax=Rhodanobacter terrae TaxID=418647 RepID=A0ABW0T0M5_9GAMM